MKYDIEFVKYILVTNKAKLIILSMITMNIFMVLTYAPNNKYIDAFFTCVTSKIYVAFILMSLFLSTYNTFNIFDKYRNVIIRYDNKKQYFLKLIKVSSIVNMIFLTINLMLLLTGLNLFTSGFEIQSMTNVIQNYNITNLSYSIFYIIRLLCLFQLITTFYIICLKFINYRFVAIISLVFTSFIIFFPYNDIYVNSISNIFCFIGSYMEIHRYISFGMEFLISIIYICLSSFFLLFFFQFSLTRMKDIGD